MSSLYTVSILVGGGILLLLLQDEVGGGGVLRIAWFTSYHSNIPAFIFVVKKKKKKHRTLERKGYTYNEISQNKYEGKRGKIKSAIY